MQKVAEQSSTIFLNKNTATLVLHFSYYLLSYFIYDDKNYHSEASPNLE